MALEAGYRHIDCAPVYLNEQVIGRVLKSWIDSGKLKREDVFITTKLPPPGNRPSCVERYLRKSLTDLQLDFVDLYLIHCPFTVLEDPSGGDFIREENGDIKLDLEANHVDTWKVKSDLQFICSLETGFLVQLTLRFYLGVKQVIKKNLFVEIFFNGRESFVLNYLN